MLPCSKNRESWGIQANGTRGKLSCNKKLRLGNVRENVTRFVTVAVTRMREASEALSSSVQLNLNRQDVRMRGSNGNSILPHISEPSYTSISDPSVRRQRYPWKKIAVGAGIIFLLWWFVESSKRDGTYFGGGYPRTLQFITNTQTEG